MFCAFASHTYSPHKDTCFLTEEQTTSTAFCSSSTGDHRTAAKSGFLVTTYRWPCSRKESTCLSSVLHCVFWEAACGSPTAAALPASRAAFGEQLMPKGETGGKMGVLWLCLNLQQRTMQLLSHSFPLPGGMGRRIRGEKGKNSLGRE